MILTTKLFSFITGLNDYHDEALYLCPVSSTDGDQVLFWFASLHCRFEWTYFHQKAKTAGCAGYNHGAGQSYEGQFHTRWFELKNIFKGQSINLIFIIYFILKFQVGPVSPMKQIIKILERTLRLRELKKLSFSVYYLLNFFSYHTFISN